MNRRRAVFVLAMVCALAEPSILNAAAPMGGFIPYVGLGLTNRTKPDTSDTFFLADPSYSPQGTFLGPGSSAYYDIAILDTGGAAHIFTHDAHLGFNIQAEGFEGTETFPIGTANGIVTLDINETLGVYVAGLGDKISAGATLVMDSPVMRGQTTVATLSAPANGWALPNIVGLPIAAHHAIAILNSEPQIFEYHERTVRTPQIELRDLGSAGGNILRRAPLKILPGESFITGPLYLYTLDVNSFEFVPISPTVVPNGGLFLEVDMTNGGSGIQDKDFLFDTGADLTIISEVTASRLGFDPVYDTPDFFLEVNTPAGLSGGVPGIFIDELNIDTVGGHFKLTNVPVAILDLPNPNQPGNNLIGGVIGMNLFNDRNLVIDAIPAIGQGGPGPSLYISDPVTQTHTWATAAASGNWATAGNWNAAGSPDKLWVARAANFSGSNQTAVVSANGNPVHQLIVSGTPTATMTVHVNSGVTLTTFQETRIEAGGRIVLAGMLDTLFVNIEGGVLAGTGTVLAGTGPIKNPVRNLSGRVEPGAPIGQLTIDGDFSQQAGGTLAIDLAGAGTLQYDRLVVDNAAFLNGTLEVTLSGYSPSIGAEFTILTAGHVFGEFADLVLPAEYQWNVDYEDLEVILSVTGISVTGDFNNDGTVDAADYVMWQKLGGSAGDYLTWQGTFGESPGSGSSTTGNPGGVPEPCNTALLLLAVCGLALSRKRATRAARSASWTKQGSSSCR